MTLEIVKNDSFESSSLYQKDTKEEEFLFKKKKLSRACSNILSEIYEHLLETTTKYTCFDCQTPPRISISDYLNRMEKLLNNSGETYVIALMYIDRFCRNNITLSKNNIHKIFLISMRMASKYLEDSIEPNSQYAIVGGIPVEELILMEETFLKGIQFNLYIQPEDYSKYYNKIIQGFSP